jgi:hypothetical protein
MIKINKLYHHLVYVYHNEHKQWLSWAEATEDMWEDRCLTGAERKKRCMWLKKGGKYAPKEQIMEEICFILEQKCFHKLFFLLKNTEKGNATK